MTTLRLLLWAGPTCTDSGTHHHRVFVLESFFPSATWRKREREQKLQQGKIPHVFPAHQATARNVRANVSGSKNSSRAKYHTFFQRTKRLHETSRAKHHELPRQSRQARHREGRVQGQPTSARRAARPARGGSRRPHQQLQLQQRAIRPRDNKSTRGRDRRKPKGGERKSGSEPTREGQPPTGIGQHPQRD
jgi:hypothetical protein